MPLIKIPLATIFSENIIRILDTFNVAHFSSKFLAIPNEFSSNFCFFIVTSDITPVQMFHEISLLPSFAITYLIKREVLLTLNREAIVSSKNSKTLSIAMLKYKLN